MKTKSLENIKTTWLGNFPKHWRVLRIKNLFQEIDSRSENGNEELLSVSYHTGVYLKRESLENEDDHLTNATSLIGYKKVAKGDLIINIMGAWNGRLGISPYDGITSPAYCVYRLKDNNNPEYYGYLFRTKLYVTEFLKYSAGIGTGYLRLYSDKFFSIFTVVPPKEEQDEIVQYIKSQEEKINLFIQKKQRFIELLKEQRQAVICDKLMVVSNQYAEKRLKYICYLQRGHDLSKENFVEEGHLFPVYGSNGIIGYHNQFTTKGPCITVGRSGSVGEVNIIEVDFWAHNTCLYVNNNFGNDWDYLFYVLSSIDIKMVSNGSAVPTLDRKDVHELKFPVPPTSEEQKQIVSQIKTETATIDTAITKTEKEIELIREYKEAMISEAVMGNRKLNFVH